MPPSKFIISFKGNREDRKHCIDNILSLMPDTHVIDAVDGWTLNLSQDNERYAPTFGCTASHVQIFKYCLKNNIKNPIIMEDDLALTQKAAEILQNSENCDGITTFCRHSQLNKFLCAACYQINENLMAATINNLEAMRKTTLLYHIDRLITNTLVKNKIPLHISGLNLEQESIQPSRTRTRQTQVKTSIVWGSPKQIPMDDLDKLIAKTDEDIKFIKGA